MSSLYFVFLLCIVVGVNSDEHTHIVSHQFIFVNYSKGVYIKYYMSFKKDNFHGFNINGALCFVVGLQCTDNSRRCVLPHSR